LDFKPAKRLPVEEVNYRNGGTATIDDAVLNLRRNSLLET
jgi:hypothetical protein